MRELLILLKNRFANTYNLNKFRNINKAKFVLYFLLAIYVIASLSFTFYTYAKGAADVLSKFNLISYMLVLFFILSSFTTFMFTIYNAKSSMFNANDNDLLLSMPIKPSTILASRLIFIMAWNLMTSLFVMVPAFVVYAMYVNVSFVYYLYAFITFILLPVIPTILASIFGYIIAYFTSKGNAKNFIEVIMSFTFIGLIYYGIAQAENILKFMTENISGLDNILKWCFYPVYLISEVFNDNNILSLVIFIVLNIGLFVIFTYLLSRNFKNIIAKLQENRTKSNYVLRTLKTESVSKILYTKELKRYFSSPVYVMNTLFGLVMIIVAAVGTIFYDKNQILAMLEMNGTSSMFQLLSGAVAFIVFLSCTTSASISLEGKNYWILKTLPIKANKIFNSKILLNMSIVLPIVYISLIIFKFTLNLNIAEFLMLILLATVCSFVSSKIGLLVNLKFPKMDAVNDTVIVKRSLSVMICVLAPMAIVFGMGAIYSMIEKMLGFNVFILLVITLLVIVDIACRVLLKIWGTERFKQIN